MIDSIVKYIRGFVAIRGKRKDGTYMDVVVDDNGNLGVQGSAVYLSPLPAFVARSSKVLATGVTQTDTYTMTQAIALIDFHFGGRGPGQATISRLSTTASLVPNGGGFNSIAECAVWAYTGAGSPTAPSPDYSTAQFHAGTGSLRLIYPTSDNNHKNVFTNTFSSPQDLSSWVKLSAWFYNDAVTGVSRTLSAILTDVNGSTNTYSLTGTMGTAPFTNNTWVNLLVDLSNPTATTGTFDIFNVASMSLQFIDSGNKSGTIYWDDVKFLQQSTVIERIYISGNQTYQLQLNPVELFAIGDILSLSYKNNDTASREFTATAKGVLPT